MLCIERGDGFEVKGEVGRSRSGDLWWKLVFDKGILIWDFVLEDNVRDGMEDVGRRG